MYLTKSMLLLFSFFIFVCHVHLMNFNTVAENNITCSIPTGVGVLTKLTKLDLRMHSIYVLLVYFYKACVFYAFNFLSLNTYVKIMIETNELTGSIPAKIVSRCGWATVFCFTITLWNKINPYNVSKSFHLIFYRINCDRR